MAPTLRQQRFIEEYMVDLNGTQAAIRAGYSARTANRQASHLLSKPDIRSAIETERRLLFERIGITRERVLRELTSIGFADPRAAVEWGAAGIVVKDSSKLRSDQVAAIGEVVETKNGLRIKWHDKVRALELLARHLGMFEGTSRAVSDVRIVYLEKGDEDL